MGYVFWIALLWLLLDRARHPRHPLQLNVYFGVPGSGKTTYAAYLAKQARRESVIIRLCRRFPCRFTNWILDGGNWKREYPVWSNVPIAGTLRLNAREDIGVHMIRDGKMIIDEAGVEFNSRNYKTFPQTAIKFFKYHRHYGVSVDVFSQSFEDMDVTLRRLAQNFYVVKKSVLPFFIVTKRIRRRVGIDDKTHQLCDAYFFGLPILDTKWIFCPPLWKMFDSYDFEELPEKEWTKWPGPEDVTSDDDEEVEDSPRGPFSALGSFFSRIFFLPDEEEDNDLPMEDVPDPFQANDWPAPEDEDTDDIHLQG
ncbi:zonular occludens toxin domain-containing protein [uncultured Oscillibacter sp.]|uniref:zonular occludens toxin domain-containing protein n=1 Tax=uncultured Oscillibacter sp. TaxID=876091 RepID=UPI0025CF2149|nr:zonular occludens toxin domain-containing protein [uncultured Oscillibacter sp.]